MSRKDTSNNIQAAWVGGWPSLTKKIRPKLEREFGITLKRVIGDNPHRANVHQELGNVDLLIICTEVISHQACDPLINKAKKKEIPIIYGSKNWSTLYQRLVTAGYSLTHEKPTTTVHPVKKLRLSPRIRDHLVLEILAQNPLLSTSQVVEIFARRVAEEHPDRDTVFTNRFVVSSVARKILGITKPSHGVSTNNVTVDHTKYMKACRDHKIEPLPVLPPDVPLEEARDKRWTEKDTAALPNSMAEGRKEAKGYPKKTTAPKPKSPPPPESPEDGLISALELLREEMEKREYISLTLTIEGEVSFEKRVYRPSIEKGELKL